MKKVFIYSAPCYRRDLDAAKTASYFLKNSYKLVYNPKDADIIVFFTCAIFNSVVEWSLNKINFFQKCDARLIVAGCLPEVDGEKLSNIFKGSVISTKTIEKIDELFPENKYKFSDIEDANFRWDNYDKSEFETIIKNLIDRIPLLNFIIAECNSFFIKNYHSGQSHIYILNSKKPFNIRIGFGCNSNCSYCAIKKAVGTYKSKQIETCLKEFKKGLNEGYKYFELIADNLGPYGCDINSSLVELLDKITIIKGDYKLSLVGFDPRWAVKYTHEIEKMIKIGKIISLDIPIQSGSRRVLKLMNRYPNIEKINEAIHRFSDITHDLHISTQVIIGFPSETEEDFKQTLDFLIKSEFSTIILLPFSCRTGTAAEGINPKISKEVIFRRMKEAKKALKRNGYLSKSVKMSNSIWFYKKNCFR